ncbi:MAG: hypothetical protein ACRDS9_22345 [Pseudonocardiaceae bacterium]
MPTGSQGAIKRLTRQFVAVVGILAAISQILDFLRSGKVDIVWISLLVLVCVVLLPDIVVMIRQRRWLELIFPTVSLLAVAATIVFGSAVFSGNLPLASVLYQTYLSKNDDAAVVLRPHSNPPPNEYKVKTTLGYGYPVDVDISETHLVYDYFCTGRGSEYPCGGVRRSHFYTKDPHAASPWPKAADEVKPVARLLDADPDGQCPNDDDVAIYRFTSKTFTGATFFDVAVRMDGWDRSELLGCLRPID